MARGKVVVLMPIAGLALLGVLVYGISGRHGKPSPWTSRATFTISHVGTYTAADNTVPIGIHGNAEIDLGMGLTGDRKDFVATIGDDPDEDTNIAQWQLIFRGYHGAGAYTLPSASGGEVRIMVRDFRGDTDTWDSDGTKAAGCAIRITGDRAMPDPTIREIRGSVSCHSLYDDSRHTAATALSSHFDVFAEVWCGGDQKTQRCRPPQPLPEAPRD